MLWVILGSFFVIAVCLGTAIDEVEEGNQPRRRLQIALFCFFFPMIITSFGTRNCKKQTEFLVEFYQIKTMHLETDYELKLQNPEYHPTFLLTLEHLEGLNEMLRKQKTKARSGWWGAFLDQSILEVEPIILPEHKVSVSLESKVPSEEE